MVLKGRKLVIDGALNEIRTDLQAKPLIFTIFHLEDFLLLCKFQNYFTNMVIETYKNRGAKNSRFDSPPEVLQFLSFYFLVFSHTRYIYINSNSGRRVIFIYSNRFSE